ncbi:DUF5333 domain-containing protein [Pelagovum pacificum]|uniref:DUF5333 domain-containing protein n=1 Tax=Pelagovum pacificum TaxID=2588711 RepID=A0A5C5GD61_9RHOB|nr:DUF5333 domain-containing protein [Pelagovum pacificum]QQA44194.1 DUF5333 domain-containing protein [Pelagovum pacificum]TNY32683.1 hypothetical protein FHY64_05225 [Pelagovum pacificum]
MTRRALFILTVPMVLAGALAGQGRADHPIGQIPAIREGLIATGMALEISDNCDSLSPRMIRGLAYLEQLRGTARQAGYSNDEIDAFIDDRGEKARLESEARQRLSSRGAVSGQADTYCAVGQQEMQSGSAVGQLLR